MFIWIHVCVICETLACSIFLHLSLPAVASYFWLFSCLVLFIMGFIYFKSFHTFVTTFQLRNMSYQFSLSERFFIAAWYENSKSVAEIPQKCEYRNKLQRHTSESLGRIEGQDWGMWSELGAKSDGPAGCSSSPDVCRYACLFGQFGGHIE